MMPDDNISRLTREDVKEKLAQMPTTKHDPAVPWEDSLGQMMGKYFTALVASGLTRAEALQLASELQAKFLAIYVKG